MGLEPTIDFSTYTNADLLAARTSINRDQFPANYQACLSEIQKRKADGTWEAHEKSEAQSSLLSAQKWARAFAVLQIIGGVFGVVNFAWSFGPSMLNGLPLLTTVIILIAILAFALTAWCGLQYWKTGQLTQTWIALLLLQIPGFQLSRLSYEFFVGLKMPIGWLNGQISVNTTLSSSLTLIWTDIPLPFGLLINLVPIAGLAILNKVENSRVTAELNAHPK